MTLPAYLRIGSLEILGALAAFGILTLKRKAEPPAPPRPVRVALTVHDTPARGGERQARFVLRPKTEAIVGRSTDAVVGLLDPEVSRRHAILTLDDGVVYVSDAGSINGTFLNGKSVRGDAIELRAGDILDVGTTRMTVDEIEPS